MRYEAKRCGVNFSPPSIVLIYVLTETNTMRKRIIPVRDFSKYSDCSIAAERLKNHSRHRDYLEGVSKGQLERLHFILRDHMQGLSLEQSLASFCLHPEEDLNKLDDEELTRKKCQMNRQFERNQRSKDDPNFIYDLEVDFPKTTQEKCSWDDESDDGF
ncbi:centrosomal protein of 19 kDa [Xenentodon cancila]